MSNAKTKRGPWLVFNVGCIECGVSSDVVGIYQNKKEANTVAEKCRTALNLREGGQNSFQVFDLSKPQAKEYRAAIAKANGE